MFVETGDLTSNVFLCYPYPYFLSTGVLVNQEHISLSQRILPCLIPLPTMLGLIMHGCLTTEWC